MHLLKPASRKLAVSILAGTVAFVSTGGPVHAQGDGQESLKRQLETLTQTVGELAQHVKLLERKLDRLESRRQEAGKGEGSKRAPAAPPPAARVAPSSSQEKARPVPVKQPAPPVRRATASTPAPVALKAEHGENPTAPPTPAEAWARVKEGMTEAQVIVLLGEPTRKFKISGQTVWYYYYRGAGSGSVFFYENGRVASRQNPPFAHWHLW